MPELVWDVTLTLAGPILTQSSAPGTLGVDAPMARDHQGRPYLAGTLVKGRLSQAWSELSTELGADFPVDLELLGLKSGNRESPDQGFDPHRARLFFSDFTALNGAGSHSGKRVRVQIDPTRGAVKEHMLAVVESAFPAGQEVSFRGTIRFLARPGEDAARVRGWVDAGLRWVHSFGAERTIGFGRLLRVAVEDRAPAASTFPADGDRFEVALTTDQPFCVTEWRKADNLFESSGVIPGNVWKGALAQTWLAGLGGGQRVVEGIDPQRPHLARHYDKLIFTHAREGPVQLLSSVKWLGKGKEWDVALHKDLGGVGVEAPAFPIDWKDEPDPVVDTEIRVRTAIDRGTRRALDAALFAYEVVLPHGREWHAAVDASRVEPESDRAAVMKELAGLLGGGIRSLGKTKAAFDVRPRNGAATAKVSPRDGVYVVALQSDTLLADQGALVGEHSEEALRKAYEAVWGELSGHKLALSHYYASQVLRGGAYLWDRFQKPKPYWPYLLTRAGSVFVLEPAADEHETVVEGWLRRGLDVPKWAVECFERNGAGGDHWSNNPFVPENGFGAVAVNLADHWDRKLEWRQACAG